MKIISEIHFNWFASVHGEEVTRLIVGCAKEYSHSPTVTSIKDTSYENIPRFTVHFDDDSEEDIYNINRVFYKVKTIDSNDSII